MDWKHNRKYKRINDRTIDYYLKNLDKIEEEHMQSRTFTVTMNQEVAIVYVMNESINEYVFYRVFTTKEFVDMFKLNNDGLTFSFYM